MIREMTEEDLETVLEIENDSFFTPWSKQQYLYELNENPYSNLYVYIVDDKIVGYCDLWLIFEHAEIATIAVSKDHRKQHIGQKLMELIEEKAIENGCETISLEVRVSNQPAIDLYSKCGFIKVNTKKSYYQTSDGYEDGYFMMKGI